MKLSLKFICVIFAFFCIFSHIDAKENRCNLEKHKYKVLYDEIDYFIDERVVLILDKTTNHYCLYLIHFPYVFNKLTPEEIMTVGHPVNFEMANRIVDLEKFHLNIYGF